MRFAPDGRTLLLDQDPVIRLWDTVTGQPRFNHPAHEQTVRALAFTRDGRSLVSGAWDGTIRVWEAATGKHERALTGHHWGTLSFLLARDDATVLSGGYNGTVRLQELRTGKELRRFVIDKPLEELEEPGTQVVLLGLAPDGRSAVSFSYAAKS